MRTRYVYHKYISFENKSCSLFFFNTCMILNCIKEINLSSLFQIFFQSTLNKATIAMLTFIMRSVFLTSFL